MRGFVGIFILVALVTSEKLRLTPQELSEFDGRNGKIYLACGGVIFDVTESPSYQKSGSYSMFAGKDASVALAKHSFKPEYLTMRPEEANLTPSNQKAIDSWKEFYTEKYPIVGELVYPVWKEETL
jgi:predicted heme/steroid binding protein